MAKSTPLYQQHLDLGAKIVDFHGFLMPLQYSGIVEEHRCVRETAGVFDLSHMGEFLVEGPDATKALNYLLTNNLENMAINDVQYNILTNEKGGIIDDILIYRLPRGYYLVVNAANIEKDKEWLTSHLSGDVTFTDLSDTTSLIAVQGKAGNSIVEQVLDMRLDGLGYYQFIDLQYKQQTIRISRTGYTGEDGLEVYLPNDLAVDFWQAIFAKGKTSQIKPIGLGARDTLRLEMRMPLYGNELTEETTPIEAGLSRFVDLTKDFIGKEALVEQIEKGVERKLIGFEMIDRGVPRTGYTITKDDQQIGVVTSGTLSPSTGKAIGLAYVDSQYAKVDQAINIQVRQKSLVAKIVKGRFVTVKRKKY